MDAHAGARLLARGRRLEGRRRARRKFNPNVERGRRGSDRGYLAVSCVPDPAGEGAKETDLDVEGAAPVEPPRFFPALAFFYCGCAPTTGDAWLLN
jgi:hypothetical protein